MNYFLNELNDENVSNIFNEFYLIYSTQSDINWLSQNINSIKEFISSILLIDKNKKVLSYKQKIKLEVLISVIDMSEGTL